MEGYRELFRDEEVEFEWARMAPLDGIETTLRILRAGPETKVLVLTTHALDQYLFDALRAGASGFPLKDTPPEEIVEGIRSVASGHGCCRRS